jgi:putative DNA methylase
MIEIPPKFAGMPPVHPPSPIRRGDGGEVELMKREWKGAQGLAEDVRYYGKWMRDEAEKRIGHLYPKVKALREKDGSYRHATQEEIENPQSKIENLTVIAWIWARTVKSPNPAFANVDVPLASTFMLSTKVGKESYVEPIIEKDNYRFTVKAGKPKNAESAKNGTKVGRGGNFQCIMSGTPIPVEYIRKQGISGTLGSRLMAIVAEGSNGRVYFAPDTVSEIKAKLVTPDWIPDQEINHNPRDIRTQLYGLTKYSDLFTQRQLVALSTFTGLVHEVCEQVKIDALVAIDLAKDGDSLATVYSDSIGVYMAFSVDKAADYWSTICTWHSSKELIRNTFGRQAIPMAWDYVETNVFSDSSGNISSGIEWAQKALCMFPAKPRGFATQGDAQTQNMSLDRIVSTDPPYYDNIGYADLSDFFYVWLRRSLKTVFPELFSTLAVPKVEELVATPYRHGSRENAEVFFLNGMTQAMNRLAEQSHPAFPVTIYYAFKQSESDGDDGMTNTGWDTFLAAVIEAGFAISGTWPMRTELSNRMIGSGTNALASSIVLVCRKREVDASTVSRRDFVNALKTELPKALAHLQAGNIAPVDLAQAAIGPGMGIYTRYAKVLDAQGQPLTVRDALALINQTLDEALAEQEGDFDSDTRWALAWFEQSGFDDGEYGVAETLSKAKDTSVSGMVEAGILVSGRGKVRLLKPAELPADWDPSKDKRLTTWEMVHQLIRVLESDGESAAAALVAQLGAQAETARELCYRLYTICERKKRNAEALSYNGLVQSWPEITRLAREGFTPTEAQATLF